MGRGQWDSVGVQQLQVVVAVVPEWIRCAGVGLTQLSALMA